MGVENFVVFTQKDCLDSRTPGIETEIAGPTVCRQVCPGDGMLAMAVVEFVEFFLGSKERFDPVRLCQR